jgi:Skp family chaperone for outer membrane proteins
MKYSPIVLFVFNRVNHTRLVIESLLKNSEAELSELFIFSDFQKRNEDKEKVYEVRRFLKTVQGFKAINIIERDVNFGLSKSIITGVTEIVNKFGKVIVLEDDLVVYVLSLVVVNQKHI